jgi:hypothetical protein
MQSDRQISRHIVVIKKGEKGLRVRDEAAGFSYWLPYKEIFLGPAEEGDEVIIRMPAWLWKKRLEENDVAP